MFRKKTMNSTKKYRLILSAVHMVYRLVNSTYNVKELTLRLTRLLCQFIQADSASVYLLGAERKRIATWSSFNNKINIYLNKKKDLVDITEKEKNVSKGAAIIEKYIIGLPLIADDYIGAIIIKRKKRGIPFSDFDREMLSVFAEQSVTAIKNLQLYEEQQNIILESIKFIGKLLQDASHKFTTHAPVYFQIVKCLAEKLRVSQSGIECLYYASILHNVGAFNVPYNILSKSSQLTPEEFKVIRDLPAKSAELIKPVAFLKPVLPIIIYHREKYDGSGYPSGLKKEQIPFGARIIAVVDAFEAMVRGRPYKGGLSVDEALEELRLNSGAQFDPKVVKAFCELSRQRKFRNYLNFNTK